MPSSSEPYFGYLTPDNFTPTTYVCGRLRIPNNQSFVAAVMGALADLTMATSWEPFGTMTPDDAAYLALQMYNDFVKARGFCMIGQVMPYITADPPYGTLKCDGSIYLAVDYPSLYAALDPAFIVDTASFIVPDLRGLTVIGVGSFETITVAVNEVIGESTVALDVSKMPAHSHTNVPHTHILTPHTHSEGNTVPIGVAAPIPPDVVPAAIGSVGITGAASDGISTDAITIDSTGSGDAHNNVQPSLGLNYCVVAL